MIGYHVYANTGAGGPINYDSPIAAVYTPSWTLPAIAGPGQWSFGVRAFDTVTGLEEQNIDCAVDVAINALGQDVTDTPAPPCALLVLARAGGAIKVEWAYPAVSAASAPTGFNVYVGTGGSPDYWTPVATVRATSGLLGSYSVLLLGYSHGLTYAVGVRAFNAVAEELNTYQVAVTALAAGPSAVVGLTATATASA